MEATTDTNTNIVRYGKADGFKTITRFETIEQAEEFAATFPRGIRTRFHSNQGSFVTVAEASYAKEDKVMEHFETFAWLLEDLTVDEALAWLAA